MNFWHSLAKPIIGLSPMDGVTDAPFRFVVAKHGKPSVIFTEFSHVQGLWLGKIEVFKDLIFSENEKPIVAQIFGADPDYFYKAAHIICELGFDGLDINMGCPADNIVKKGGGASLIGNPKLAKKIIFETKKGIKDWTNGQTLEDIGLDKNKIEYINKTKKTSNNQKRTTIPISIKTRVGIEKNTINEWIKHLIESQPDLISIHGRTLKQLYGGDSNWETIGSISDQVHQSNILLLGNGDVKSVQQAIEKSHTYNLDGVLIGRAALGNPWIFQNYEANTVDKLNICLEHTKVYKKIKGSIHFHELKKHLGWYCRGFEEAKDLRTKLMETQNLKEVEKIINHFLMIKVQTLHPQSEKYSKYLSSAQQKPA